MRPKKFKLNRGDIGRIRKCIRRWKDMIAGREPEDCALCEQYTDEDDQGGYTCECADESRNQCPLLQAYGLCESINTRNPWGKADRAYCSSWFALVRHKPTKEQVCAMQRMVNALESLLPKK